MTKIIDENYSVAVMGNDKDFITIRSFLSENVDSILETLNIRRKSKLNNTDDLFDDSGNGEEKIELFLKNKLEPKSKFQILSDEKNSLGLYVSGNPLQEYEKILEWVKDISYSDNIHLVLVEKIKKIFTKSGGMMLAIEITTPVEELEGLVFPKIALKFSAILQEKEVYWVIGKISRKEKKEEEVSDDSEIKEYDQLPKLIIENAVIFEEGPFSILSESNITLTDKRKDILTSVDWLLAKQDPSKFGMHEPKKLSKSVKEKILKISRNVEPFAITKIKNLLQSSNFNDAVLVTLEVETTKGWRKTKNPLWCSQADLIQIEKIVNAN